MDAQTKKILLTVGISFAVVLVNDYFKVSEKVVSMAGGQ